MNLTDANERKVMVRALCLARDRKLFKEQRDRSILDRLIARAKDANPHTPKTVHGRSGATCECGHRESIHRGFGYLNNLGACAVLGCSCANFRDKNAGQQQGENR